MDFLVGVKKTRNALWIWPEQVYCSRFYLIKAVRVQHSFGITVHTEGPLDSQTNTNV